MNKRKLVKCKEMLTKSSERANKQGSFSMIYDPKTDSLKARWGKPFPTKNITLSEEQSAKNQCKRSSVQY